MMFDKSDGGGTSRGPLGFWLIDVKSLHDTPPIASAAQTLRILYRIKLLLSPKRLWPHGQGEAKAACRGQLAVLDALTVARIECGLRVDRRLLGPEQQVMANQ